VLGFSIALGIVFGDGHNHFDWWWCLFLSGLIIWVVGFALMGGLAGVEYESWYWK